ncbi:MAG: hypothetical protein BAA03_00660 [Caldibacillus debilis]|nr:MAG: hypothetical protein BAA03_00660 [Caldibacillus debilis]
MSIGGKRRLPLRPKSGRPRPARKSIFSVREERWQGGGKAESALDRRGPKKGEWNQETGPHPVKKGFRPENSRLWMPMALIRACFDCLPSVKRRRTPRKEDADRKILRRAKGAANP